MDDVFNEQISEFKNDGLGKALLWVNVTLDEIDGVSPSVPDDAKDSFGIKGTSDTLSFYNITANDLKDFQP